MANTNAFGYRIGESVDVSATQRIADEYNAALMAHIDAHKPTELDRWGNVRRHGNQGGNYRGHDLSVVYPMLGKTGVSYVEFETSRVNNTILANPQPRLSSYDEY